MLDLKITSAKDKDLDILTSMKLVTMIDDDMDKKLSFTEKNKIKKSINQNVELNCSNYKMILVDKKIAGAYLAIPYEDGYMVDEIFLFDEYRNKGIGTRIINKLKKDLEPLYIWVYKENTKALELFKRLGFNVISSGRTLILKYDKIYESIKDKLTDIKLGYIDKQGNVYGGFRYDFKDNFYLQSPKQLMESKIGSCFDQVELERELVNKAGGESRSYFIFYPDEEYDMSHSILVYKDGRNYYWLENAWVRYKGLHIYDSKEELFKDVIEKFVSTIPKGELNKVKLYMYDKPRYGINYIKLLQQCINSRSIRI